MRAAFAKVWKEAWIAGYSHACDDVLQRGGVEPSTDAWRDEENPYEP